MVHLYMNNASEIVREFGLFADEAGATEAVIAHLSPIRPAVIGIGFELHEAGELSEIWDWQTGQFIPAEMRGRNSPAPD